ncbi:basic membrane lipoprotein [Calothrix sp. NIES-4071]|nr:basic membrane lipoprotein [Calothrix sp. NIES-4071]BAZ56294.1 basic membrane lipoprotein [Calothrix sp. NIES-4105]
MERRKFIELIKYTALTGAGITLTSCGGRKNTAAIKPTVQASPVSLNQPLKVGFVYIEPVGDMGWTYAHDLGRREMEANLKEKVKTTLVENVNVDVDAEKVIRQLATDGHELIFTTSFGYMNPTIKVAQDFPQVAFEHCAGYKRAANVGTYLGRFEESRYLTGMIAGKMTKSNIIGFIGAYPIPEVIRGINAFTTGVRLTNPKAKVRVVWTQTQDDPTKEREAAAYAVKDGADILAQHTDSAAILQFAEEKGIYAFGYNTDMSKFAPKAHLTSAISQWGKFYTEKATAVIDKTWKPENTWYGIAQGMVDISPMNAVIPLDIQNLVNQKRNEIIQGIAHPFEGPIKDQNGIVRVSKGKNLDDKAQLEMDWYVEGVEGTIPKKS